MESADHAYDSAGHLESLLRKRGGPDGGGVFLALRAFLGRLRASKDFEVLRATELRIETRGRQARVATDGEVLLLDTPLRYRSRPGALRVVVPRETDDRKSP
jgi:diacylglycerol kinase family enzyme